MRARSDRALEVAVGVSVLGWAVAGLMQDGTTHLRLAMTALHVIVGVLILTRRRARREPGLREVVAALPSLLLPAVALAIAPAPEAWSWPVSIAFMAGAALAMASLMTLGRSFSVLPAVRDLVTAGPYRFVRHPAYLGEVAMACACAAAAATWASVAFPLAIVIAVAIRIGVEERMLAVLPGYARYRERVPHRLIPGVW